MRNNVLVKQDTVAFWTMSKWKDVKKRCTPIDLLQEKFKTLDD